MKIIINDLDGCYQLKRFDGYDLFVRYFNSVEAVREYLEQYSAHDRANKSVIGSVRV
jgi:hypothetical protein